MEDYKQKYEEALERARKINSGEGVAAPSDYTICETIFPELKKSEDEKIRKELHDFCMKCFHGETIVNQKADFQRWATWLEKQGKIKRSDYPYVPGWRENRPDNKPKIKHSILMLTTHGVAEGEWLGKEWCQYRWSCKIKDTEVLYWLHLSDLETLEKENVKQGEQKPAWSEEDENGFSDALYAIQQARTIAKNENDMGNLWYAENWLKFLKERMKGE